MSAPDATVSSRPLRARFVTLDDTVVPVAGVVVYEAKDPGKAVDDAIKSGEPAPYGAVLWDSATDLAKALYALDLHGHRVLELGCGCGLVGVVAALKGARVLCTDVDVHTLTATARAASDAAVDVVTDLFDFMGAAPLPLVDGAVATDVILADVLYEPMLAAAAARHPPATPTAPWRRLCRSSRRSPSASCRATISVQAPKRPNSRRFLQPSSPISVCRR